MKANLILKSMLVLLFVCGSAAVTDAGIGNMGTSIIRVVYHKPLVPVVLNDNLPLAVLKNGSVPVGMGTFYNARVFK